MIRTKKDLKEYMDQDRVQLGKTKKHPNIIGDLNWKYQIALRKSEYFANHKGDLNIISKAYWFVRYKQLGLKLGITIPLNTFGPGLNTHHYGYIVVNGNAKIGSNCNIQQGVNIGQNHTSDEVPVIGDNVYIGPGAKIFGKIHIANGVAIGANAVVNKSIEQENVTVAGVPAKIVGMRKF